MPKQRTKHEVRSAHDDAEDRRRDVDTDVDETEPDDDESAADEDLPEDEDEDEDLPEDGDFSEDEDFSEDGERDEDEQETDDEHGETDRRSGPSRRRARDRAGGLSAAEAAAAGMRALGELIAKEPQGVTSVRPVDGGWDVGVEMLEDSRVPSSADLLALYEAELDEDGALLSYRRVQRYQRGRGER